MLFVASVTEDLKSLVLKLEGRVEKLEKGGGGATTNGTSSKPGIFTRNFSCELPFISK